MTTYAVGNIVRPKRTRASTEIKSELQDWAGKLCAQGWIETVCGPADAQSSAPFWNPQTSDTEIDAVNEQRYTVKVWNTKTNAWESADYPESELDVGLTMNGNTITTLFPDPASAIGKNAANLAGVRT